MALNYKQVFNGLRLKKKAASTSDTAGELETLSSDNKTYLHNGTTNSPILTEATSASVSNKSLVDASTAIVDSSDPTKQIKFDAAGTAGTSTTLLGSQTTNKIITLPDATDTLVGKATTDTLTNKTIDANGTGNSISNLETADLAAGVLNTSTSLAGASNTQVPSALAVKTYVDTGLAAQNDAIEITNTPAGNISSTNVQAALNELDTEKAKLNGDLAQQFAILRSEVATATDSSTTGSNASLTAFTQGVIRLTSGTLVSLANIPAGVSGQQLELINRTGASIVVVDSSAAVGTAADRILTGSGANLTLVADATLLLDYDATSARWQVVGGSGSGAATSAIDNVFTINDAVDPTKQINFDASGLTSTKTTITAAQTVNRVITLPDATDTLVGKATTDTLTNKTLTAPVINSPTGITKSDVGLSNVDNTSDATKNSAVVTLTNKSLSDSSTTIVDASDATKQIKFDAAGTTGTSTTLTGSQTVNRVLTLPDATDTLVGKATTDTLTNKSISGTTNTITNVSLTTGVTGVLPVANGGTNLSTVGQETNVLKVVSGVPAWAEEDRSNLLLNPNFEGTNSSGVATSWTNSSTGSTPTITTTSGEFSEGKQAQKIALSSGVLNFFQLQNTPAGIVKEGKVGVTYRVGTAVAGFQVCSLVDGSEQVCIPTASLIIDDAFHDIEIPVIFGSTSAGIKVKSTSSTGNVFIDSAYVRTGSPKTNLQLDTVYSATMSNTGSTTPTPTSVNKAGWISSVSQASAGTYVYTIAAGIFSVIPSCNLAMETASTGPNAVSGITATSTTSVTVITKTIGIGPVSWAHQLICQKQGVDYTNSSAQVYSQASANYDWTAYTPTLGAGFGTATGVNFFHKRVGGDLFVKGTFTTGTIATSLGSISLPGSLAIDSTRVNIQNTTSNPSVEVGHLRQNGANGNVPILTATGTSTALVYTGAAPASGTQLTPTNFNSPGYSSTVTSVYFSVPIAGWTNSAYIVGTFAGTPQVPGYSAGVDTFSVSYGTTNATTVCSASPCSYLDQIGTAVSSISRSGTGAYTLNTARTYTKLKCSFTAGTIVAGSTTSCASCSALSFATTADSYGTLMCQGSY